MLLLWQKSERASVTLSDEYTYMNFDSCERFVCLIRPLPCCVAPLRCRREAVHH